MIVGSGCHELHMQSEIGMSVTTVKATMHFSVVLVVP
jgi:hypothetical protein